MTVIKPEFLMPNFIHPAFNSSCSITLTPTLNWYQDNKKYLYDGTEGEQFLNYNKGLLYTTGADNDDTDVVIKVDLGDQETVGVIRLCNTNGKEVKVEYSTNDSSYTTIINVSGNTKDYLQWYDIDSVVYQDNGYIGLSDTLKYLITPNNQLTEVSCGITMRYIKITLGATQVADSEKYLGELYIGDLYYRAKNISLMSDSLSDTRSSDITMFNNKSNRKVNNPVLSQHLTFTGLTVEEFKFLKHLVAYGLVFNFIPNPLGITNLTHNFDGKSIYMCQTRTESLNYQSFGSSADGDISVTIKEAAIVNRQF
jgi:hypothetical protein